MKKKNKTKPTNGASCRLGEGAAGKDFPEEEWISCSDTREEELEKGILNRGNSMCKDPDTGQAPVALTVILATQEAEIRRIAIQSQHGQIVHKTLSQNNPSKPGLMAGLTG
jgi:hypothetical protein